ncbi:hypothetical protein GC098_07760 [Paenibacillus sp. LMG 31458]|uniref:Uncharacterized protein n=1 Tax=Paenibacillus phytorum TaxID=2654977 RepID=A0ABX1XTX9_9BACL|nr:hypothetical protein [Paenibacillus phytorum]
MKPLAELFDNTPVVRIKPGVTTVTILPTNGASRAVRVIGFGSGQPEMFLLIVVSSFRYFS